MMENVKVRVIGTKMHVEADLTGDVMTSSKGHTIVATTGNWTKEGMPEGHSFNFVVIRKRGAKVPADVVELKKEGAA